MKPKKLISAVLAIMMIVSVIPSLTPIRAKGIEWGEGDTIESAESELSVFGAPNELDYLIIDEIGVIKQRYTYFLYKTVDSDGHEINEVHPVYCTDPTKGGAYQDRHDVFVNRISLKKSS